MPLEDKFAALAAPQRLRILRLVRDEALPVGAIAERCDASQQAVSHHLQVLRDVGLVDVQPDGRRRLYAVNPDGFEDVSEFIGELWPSALRRLRDAVEADER